jgi:hypothetical protein
MAKKYKITLKTKPSAVKQAPKPKTNPKGKYA